MYKLSCGVISGLFGGAIYGLAFGFIFGVDGAITMAISGGISFAISVGLDAERIAPIETWNFSEWSWKSFFQVVDYPKGAGKGITLPGMITFLITSSFLSGFSGAEIEIKRTPNQGIWKSVANAGTVALISGGFGWLLGWGCKLKKMVYAAANSIARSSVEDADIGAILAVRIR